MHMTLRFAVLGNPIAHSRSPEIHALFAEQAGIALSYDRVLVEPGCFGDTVRKLQGQGFRGANVTLPFKQEAWRLAGRLTDRAQKAGAVNTLSFQDGRIAGDNTDGAGLLRDLEQNLGVNLEGRRVLLLGAGGAARGVLHPLLEFTPKEVVISNRTFDRASELAGQDPIAGRTHAQRFEDLSGAFDLIINATSASLLGDVPAVPERCFASTTMAYDMMYGAAPSAFMDHAASLQARVSDGLGMLVEQAAEAFWGWHGVRPATLPVIAAIRQQLAA